MWGYVFAAVGALCGAWLVYRFWDDIRDQVAAWLRECGLDKSVLMDAWIVLDRLAVGIRRKIFVETKQTGEVMISETTFALDKIDDPETRVELEKRGHVKKQILEMIN